MILQNQMGEAFFFNFNVGAFSFDLFSLSNASFALLHPH
ncbi:Hypothetical protein EAG7_00610 [Klebsiella aerogenes]|nr:Hypothetical protein EAG7_00610 [Klebsiella aerogenes]